MVGPQWRAGVDNATNFIVNTWTKKPASDCHIHDSLSIRYVLVFLLDSYTDAALPFLDALVTWGAVIATYMVCKKSY